MKMGLDYGEGIINEGEWMRYVRVSLAAILATFVVSVPAFASGNSALKSAYGSTPHNVGAVVATKKPAAKPSRATTVKPAAVKPSVVKPSGTLPFTGLDLGVVAAAAVALLGVGLAFRRLGRQPS
jgi:hypothetical protein